MSEKMVNVVKFEILKLSEIRPAYRGWHTSRGIYLLSITRLPVKPPNIDDINEELG
jgi:hypothetical protein